MVSSCIWPLNLLSFIIYYLNFFVWRERAFILAPSSHKTVTVQPQVLLTQGPVKLLIQVLTSSASIINHKYIVDKSEGVLV